MGTKEKEVVKSSMQKENAYADVQYSNPIVKAGSPCKRFKTQKAVEVIVGDSNATTLKRKIFISPKRDIVLENENKKLKVQLSTYSVVDEQIVEYKNEVILFLKKFNLSDSDIENLINDEELKNAIKNGYSAEIFAQALLF